MKQETNTNKIEREYVIPLRSKCKRVPRYKKTNKAIKTIREFLVRHMKIRDRDLSKIKIDKYLNEEIWFRGIKKPPAKIKVKVIKEGEIVKVELFEFPEKLRFKKEREEKRDKKADKKAKEKSKKIKEIDKKQEKEIPSSTPKSEQNKEDKSEDTSKETDKKEKKEENKEKKTAVIESMQKMEKDIAKKTKHEMGGKTKQPKHQIRKALNK